MKLLDQVPMKYWEAPTEEINTLRDLELWIATGMLLVVPKNGSSAKLLLWATPNRVYQEVEKDIPESVVAQAIMSSRFKCIAKQDRHDYGIPGNDAVPGWESQGLDGLQNNYYNLKF